MKQKLKSMLAIACIATMMVTSNVLASTSTSNGTINFTEGTVTIVTNNPGTDPDGNPESVDTPNKWQQMLEFKDLDFGSHKLELTEKKVYDSTVDSENPENEYTGIIIRNETIGKAQVQVSVGKFFDEYDNETLQGFSLDLTEKAGSLLISSNGSGLAHSVTGIKADQAPVTVLDCDKLSQVGVLMSGKLEVLAGTQTAGDSKAIMTITTAYVD